MPSIARPELPILIFDGRCPFCTACAEWTITHARRPMRIVPFQKGEHRRYGLTDSQVAEMAWWVETNGKAYGGGQASAKALGICGPPYEWLGRLMSWPPLRAPSQWGYRLVSANRSHLPGTEAACKRPEFECNS